MTNSASSLDETPVIFSCSNKQLMGVAHSAEGGSNRGVVIVVGGPQYRVGSHRQFLLLARGLAAQGIPVFRFDCRGMGDSEGEFPGFENIDEDIHAAINTFFELVPTIKEVVIWGLCDGASAASFYAPSDPRVVALVLANPWIRTEQGEAKAYLKHYYLNRLMNRAFWSKLVSGKFDLSGSLRSLMTLCKQSFNTQSKSEKSVFECNTAPSAELNSLSLPDRFYQSLKSFPNPVLLIISGNDLTAAEFLDVINAEKRWRKITRSKNFHQKSLPEADHTFSKQKWMSWVIAQTIDWVKVRD